METETKINKKCYIVYKSSKDVTISMILNHNTDLETSRKSKIVHNLKEISPDTYIYCMEMPNDDFLYQKNTVLFKICYSPEANLDLSYYSDVHSFSLDSSLINYFMIGLKFKPSLQNLKYIDPPGNSLNNQITEFCYFFHYIIKESNSFSSFTNILNTGLSCKIINFKLLNDLIRIFKILNKGSLFCSQNLISNYFEILDKFALNAVFNNSNSNILILLVCMYGIFPFDFFTGREFSCKSANTLISAVVKCVNIEDLSILDNNIFEDLKLNFINGYYLLINITIKEGHSEWTLVSSTNHINYLEGESIYWNRVYDYIRKTGIPLKDKQGFISAKNELLKSYFSREKTINNHVLVFTQILKNIGILALDKENLFETVFEFYDKKYLNQDRLKTLKDEIKRKTWDLNSIENYCFYIDKLVNIISMETGQIKDEFKSLTYENTASINYLFCLLRSLNYEGVDCFLLKKSLNNIVNLSLSDYIIVLKDLRFMNETTKNYIIESGFLDKLKSNIKKISLPFNKETKLHLNSILLNLELFPNGSLDYIREYIKNKPDFDDLYYLISKCLVNQKLVNSTKKYSEIWLNIKNHIINSFVDIKELIRYFSIILDAIPNEDNQCNYDSLYFEKLNIKANNSQSNTDFKNWLTEEFWKSVCQRYSNEVFLSLGHIFDEDYPEKIVTNDIIRISYFKYIDYYLTNLCNEIILSKDIVSSYNKINVYFSSMSLYNTLDEKVLCINNKQSLNTTLLIFNKLQCTLNYELAKSFILNNPSKEFFWYKIIKIIGKHREEVLNNNYIKQIKTLILQIFDKLYLEEALISDFLLIDNQNNNQRESIISYFYELGVEYKVKLNIKHLEISVDNELYDELKKSKMQELHRQNEVKNAIKDIIETRQLKLIKKLKILNDLESFFSNYGNKIEESKLYKEYLKQVKGSYSKTQLKDLVIRNDLETIITEVNNINKWDETVMFRNIFNSIYQTELNEIIKSNELKDVKNESIKLKLSDILKISNKAQINISETLNDILYNLDFSKLTLSKTKEYFKGLNNYNNEAKVINSMIPLQESKLYTLKKILSTYCDITNSIKFSKTMLNLNNVYNFKSNNKDVYNEFIILINNKDTSFDKIFEASNKLNELKHSYFKNTDIQNILYEISKGQELITFLLNTPEDDIRNMVDAVDEHGDSFIRVQTIRDLLIIGSFIRRLQLKDFTQNIDNNPTEEEFIERIHTAFSKSYFKGLEVILNQCSYQFLGIKHLHGELSNREEASKIKAKEIANYSEFKFEYNIEKLNYEVICLYGKSNKKINLRDLCDLRDRVLLLLYNEKDQKEDIVKDVIGLDKKVSSNQNSSKNNLLVNNASNNTNITNNECKSLRDILSSFIKSIELTEKILFVLQDIFHNGYPMKFSKLIKLEKGNYSSFQSIYESISLVNKQWNEDLKDAYVNNYALTLYTGNQFWEIESLLIKASNEGIELIDHLQGYCLLKLCSPNIKPSDLEKVDVSYDLVNNVLDNMDPKERILKLGKSLGKLIDFNNIGEKQLSGNINKVHLNLKGNKFIYSNISNMKIYSYLLSIHISIDNSIPSLSQVLYCTKKTTFHEIISFLYRTAYSPVSRLFTIIKVENLSFELQNFLVDQVNKLSKNKATIKGILSIICSDNTSFLHAQFSENNNIHLIRDFDVLDELLIAECLKSLHLNTTIVRSDDTGTGKTFFIKSKCNNNKQEYIDFPILDSISIDKIVHRLFKYNKNSKNNGDKFIHLTLMGIIDNYEMLDYILFCFIIIGKISYETHVSDRDLTDPLYIEVANTYNDFLFSAISIFNILPDIEFLTASENIGNIIINKEYDDPLQLVVNYLTYFDKDELNETEINPEVQLNVQVYSKEECLEMLNKYFIKDKTDITFRQINIFVTVLYNQISKFSENYYFSVENIEYIQDESLQTIRQKIMAVLIEMTEEFTTRSIKEAREQQNLTSIKLKRSYSREEQVNLEEAKYDEIDTLGNILSWSSSNHLLIMFHADGMCVTPVYREADKVNEDIKDLVESQRTNLEDYQVFSHFELLEKLLNIVGKDFQLDELSKQTKYILTVDNFLKMLLIIMRARCGIPVVIMGETGCGKTSLVRFLATEIMHEGFESINFHAGIKEQNIIDKMQEIILLANSAKVTDNFVWVFLDEINTCDCLGIITELIVNKTLLGVKLPDNIVFIAACNPYKVRKANNEVGLIKQRVSTRLVYRVHPLPDSLIDYVWDYGSLSDDEERLYIGNILQDISGEIKESSIDIVCKSQQFIRKTEDKYSVSLRDVSRFNTLHEWFFNMLTEKNNEISKDKNKNALQYYNYISYYGHSNIQGIKYIGKIMISRKALILSLMMCYYNRISKNSDRISYKRMITDSLNIKINELEDMINEEQMDMITRMEIPPAIAINKALLENVFTLIVCVINKIPLFICGKPGCSKSLSVQLLVSNLRGSDSNDSFFKKLPRILAIPYQGSESSTSEGIEKIYEKAKGVLNNSHDNSILPLIIFDEIGLAEISKNNPLKVLHYILEPEKADIAFVGISNWRLDASKMNRAVYLARPDPDLEDLENTALSIFEYYIKEPKFDEKLIMKTLAKTYYEFKKEQKEKGYADFHGTRDFYALLKQVTREINHNYNNYNEMKLSILKNALYRNFGGLNDSTDRIINIFSRYMNLDNSFISLNSNSNSNSAILSNDIISLVKQNLEDRDSRFLLLFTNGESASYILDTYLKLNLKERVFIIGSEFSSDKNKEEHSFKLLSDIILFMESGSSIILKNLDQIYGSLYDLFNQNFMIVGDKKNCRIALGSTNNPMCYVNNAFHCVVLVDIKDMANMDPPFLNRFEKQILTFETILSLRQKAIVKELNEWISNIVNLATESNNKIDPTDLIISFNNEMPPSIVLTHFANEKSNSEILELCKKDVLSVSSVSLIVYSILSIMYQNARDEVLRCHKIYFEEQCHDSLDAYLNILNNKKFDCIKAIVYTYSNILDNFNVKSISIDKISENNTENNVENKNTNHENIEEISSEKGLVNNSQNIIIINIAEIKAEKEFDTRFKKFMSNPNYNWVFIKFDAEKEKEHVSMIKFKIDKYLQEAKRNLNENEFLDKNVLIIIYLTRKNNIDNISKSKNNKIDRAISDKLSINTQANDYLESHFLSGWEQNMIDCLGGGQIDNLKTLLDLTTLEIIKKNVDQKSITELIFDIYLKFNFNTYNSNDISLVKLYITETIHKIENDNTIFDIIFNKCLELLEQKELPDWKLKICCDNKIINKSLNTFSAIKMVIQDIISDPLLKIIHYLETESALNSYFHDDLNSEKSAVFKKIWIQEFESKDFSTIYPYNIVQSLNVNCIFNLSFPFSKNDIYEVISGIKSHIDAVNYIDKEAFNFLSDTDVENKLNSDVFNEMKLNFNKEIESISNICRMKSNFFKTLDRYSERSIELRYISDLLSYFLVVEIKKEHKWKSSLEIIIRKCIGFDIDNLEYIYIFLFKNRNVLDSLFNIFNILLNIHKIQYIENILLKDSLYDKNLLLLDNLQYRRSSELNTFSNIFNTFSQVIICQINSLKLLYDHSNEDIYGKMLNVYITSLINFSLELRQQLEVMNLIQVVNEFLKYLTNLFGKDKQSIALKVQGIFLEDYEKIDIKDFNIVNDVLSIMDSEMNNLIERSKIPENEIPSSLIINIKESLITSKLTMFESVLNGNCEFDTKKTIIKNILNNENLCLHSSMIFRLLYKDCYINENIQDILTFPISMIIQNTIDVDNELYNYENTICSFIVEFFRKYYWTPSKEEEEFVEEDNLDYDNILVNSSSNVYTSKNNNNNKNKTLDKKKSIKNECKKDIILNYLVKHYDNFHTNLIQCHSNNIYTNKFARLVSFSFVKHYLEIYGEYAIDESCSNDNEIFQKINKVLSDNDKFIDILKQYVLKVISSKLGGTANGLINLEFKDLNLLWANKKLFETNDNVLALEPNLPLFEKLNKEYSLFFLSLINEDNNEIIDKFINLIRDAKDKPDLKFVINQFFINKIWLSYSNSNFTNSHSYNLMFNLLDKVKLDIENSLGEANFKFITLLVNNFDNCEVDFFKINCMMDSNKVGMLLLSLQAYNSVLSFNASEISLSKLFYSSNNNKLLLNNLDHFDNLYIPGGFADYHDENILLIMKDVSENYQIYGTQTGLYECICGFLYTIGDCTRPYYIGTCPNCNGQIGGKGHRLLDGHVSLITADNRNEPNRKQFVLNYLKKKLKNKPGYISKMADELPTHYCIRGTSPIGFRFLNHIVLSIILLMWKTDVVNLSSLEKLFNVQTLNISPKNYIINHLNTNCSKLSNLIKSKEYYLLMHLILSELLILSKDDYKFGTSVEREMFEIAFETKIILPKLENTSQEISKFKQALVTKKKLTYFSLIDEDYNYEDVKSLSDSEFLRIFRYTKVGYWEDMKNEFLRQKNSERHYQFIKIIIDKFDEIQLISNLYPIITFTNYMMNLCNYKFSRAEAKEIKIKDILQDNPTGIAMFKEFCKSWNKICYKVTQWACKQLTVLERIDYDMPLSFVLVDDRELGYGMYMAAAFQYLARIQNEVLEGIVYLINENNNYQIWGNMDTNKYQIQKISPYEIIMYETNKNYVKELTDLFSRYYDIFNSNFGQGAAITYNFEKIENELSIKLLINKKFLNYEDLNKIQYKFELLSIQNKHSNLLNDIKEKINQKMLSIEDCKDIKNCLDKIEKQNVAYINQIFSSMEIILCNLRYVDNSSSLENTNLSVYINKIPNSQKICLFLKSTQPLCSIMLSNVLSFYSLIEEHVFKYMVEYISSDYTNELDDITIRNVLNWFHNYAEAAPERYPTSDQLIKVLQRFIIRCLVATVKPDCPIKEYLSRIDFWDVNISEDIIDNFYFEFLDDILVANTIPFLDLIIEYHKSKSDDGKGIDIANDKYKFDAIREEMFKKRNKFN